MSKLIQDFQQNLLPRIHLYGLASIMIAVFGNAFACLRVTHKVYQKACNKETRWLEDVSDRQGSEKVS